ncbi:Antifreeze protein [Acidisarcina polymorpha]|uniref:Antifreeze protein n=1 Tax=Acidisarcina polymorpha TaxID=2211140 RepID=A0A2Z5G3N4_9BACT|nr:ice-binding family protein [Acidisarcina polymorpha]AXC13235.1 Antifreeze protein [Acidisarcina polymorpha]
MMSITPHPQGPRRLPITKTVVRIAGAVLLVASSNMLTAQVAPSLGEAQRFAVLAGSTVTNTGASVLDGDLGVSPGKAVTGFPPGTLARGAIHAADAMAAQAQTDTTTAYNNLAAEACTTSYGIPTELGGKTLTPGVYCLATSGTVTGTLTLDAGGNPNAVWVFKVGSTVTTAASSSVNLINSAQQHNVFWQVGSSVTLGTGSKFQGEVLALTSISFNSGASLLGRALARNGAVTLNDNAVSFCVCIEPYDAIASKVVKTITVAPTVNSVKGSVFGATLSPDAKSIWVAGYNGTTNPGFVSLVDIESQAVTSKIGVGAGPADIAFSAPGGRAFVTNRYGASVSMVQVSPLVLKQTLDLSHVPLQLPFGIVDANSHILITTMGNDGLVADVASSSPLTIHGSIAIPGQSGRPATLPANGTYYPGKVAIPVFVSTSNQGTGYPSLVIVDPTQDSIVARVSLTSSGAAPEAVVVSPDGKYAYVSLFDSTGAAGGVWVVSLENLSTKTVIITCDAANYGEAMSADGKYLLVAGFLENQVALIDTETDSVDTIIKGGHNPNAIALTKDNSEAFFTNQGDGTVTVVSFVPSL